MGDLCDPTDLAGVAWGIARPNRDGFACNSSVQRFGAASFGSSVGIGGAQKSQITISYLKVFIGRFLCMAFFTEPHAFNLTDEDHDEWTA